MTRDILVSIWAFIVGVFIVALVVFLLMGVACGDDALLSAMRVVESSGKDDAVGDGGRSRGPLQIQKPYWTDALEQLRREGASASLVYERDVWDFEKSCIIVRAYWRRYCVVALNDGDRETLARCHVGGPRGASRRSTLGYWRRVNRELAGEREKARVK